MKRPTLLPTACALLIGGSAMAQNALIDFQGYAWETGGFPASVADDVLSIVGVVDSLDARFGVNLAVDEVTLHVTGLVSAGQVDIGGGILSISYSGGTIDLYRDPARDHDYGIDPPNLTAPPSFTNGALFLGGTFSSFFLYFDPGSGSGAYEGNCLFTSGSGLTTLNQLNASAYTFGGTLDANASGGSVPQGYDLQVDGIVEVEVIVGVEPRTWGSVKEMYRR